jgi:membrane-associated phospholipid phosphatase
MKNIFASVLLSCLILFAQAQYKPYELSVKKDVPIFTAGASLIVAAHFMKQRKASLTEAQINMLDRSKINNFDINATYNWNTRAAKWSDGIMFAAIASPVLFLAGKNSRSDIGRIAAISSQVFVVNTGLTFITKELVKRNRPFTYNPDAPLHKKMEKDATSSFFSGHTSATAAMTFSFAQMHSDYYPNSRARPAIWFSAATLPLVMGILRSRAGKHFWTDILVGYAVGAVTGIVIPRIHRVDGFRN